MANSTITGLTLVSGVSTIDRFVLDRGVGTFGIAGDVLVSSIAGQISGTITSAVEAAIVSVNAVVSGLEDRISAVSTLAAAGTDLSAVSAAITSVNAVVSGLEDRISAVSTLAAAGGTDLSAVSAAISANTAAIVSVNAVVSSLEDRISAVSALTGGGGGGQSFIYSAFAIGGSTNTQAAATRGHIVRMLETISVVSMTCEIDPATSPSIYRGYIATIDGSNVVQTISKTDFVSVSGITPQTINFAFPSVVAVSNGQRVAFMVGRTDSTSTVQARLSQNTRIPPHFGIMIDELVINQTDIDVSVGDTLTTASNAQLTTIGVKTHA